MPDHNIKLGQTCRDVLTTFEGTVVSLIQNLTGCDQACLKPAKLDKDGKPMDGQWFDVTRLQILSKPIVRLPGNPASNPGADNAADLPNR
jgi:hypothetical protein